MAKGNVVRTTEYRFEWDEKKNRQNIKKHGLDFADAPKMWRAPLLAVPDLREDYGEERWFGIGLIRELVAAVAFAEPEPGTIRIISLRKATRDERTHYSNTIENGLEAYRFHEGRGD